MLNLVKENTYDDQIMIFFLIPFIQWKYFKLTYSKVWQEIPNLMQQIDEDAIDCAYCGHIRLRSMLHSCMIPMNYVLTDLFFLLCSSL